MKIFAAVCTFFVLAWLVATTSIPRAPTVQPCSPEWFSYLDSHYFDISDGEGHGPDLGSSEWLGGIEQAAKLPIKQHLSDNERCHLIQSQLEHHIFIINQQLGVTLLL